MIIAVDEEIPYWEEAFSQLGQIRLFSGRDLKPGDIHDADVLIVRTITPVNAALLDGSSVRFVAAASAGNDHVDQGYLRSRGIHFYYTAGSNADSVSEYIASVLHIIASRKGWELKSKSLAVIGVGNVGSRVANKAELMGMQTYLCDPPLKEMTGDARYRDLNEVLRADILTFHVPLSSSGPHPTLHMVDNALLKRLSPGQFIINSSRGGVVDGTALKSALAENRLSGAALDVWEGEPGIDYSLLELVDIGTPHIAGVALDGKIRATEMVREELSRYFGIPTSALPASVYPENKSLYSEPGTGDQETVTSILVQASELLKKDSRLRLFKSLSAGRAAAAFDQLRNELPLRLEFRHFNIHLSKTQTHLAGTFQDLGFKTHIEN